MRIALLSYEYPPETGFGGIGTYTWTQARALARLGHEVHVVAGSAEPAPLFGRDQDGVRVWRARGSVTGRALGPLNRLRLWWTRNRLDTALTMAGAVRTLQRWLAFDVMEMPECGGEGLIVTRVAKAPTVIRYHSPARLIMPYYDVRRADVILCGALEGAAMRAAGTHTACSTYLRDAVRRELGVHAPITVIPNGMDLDAFDRADVADARGALGLPADRPLVVFAGRLERRKGIHLCPDIVTRVLATHDAAFVFAGDDLFGFGRDVLLPGVAAQPHQGSVHCPGRLPLPVVRALIRQADVVLIPSLWESCPYSCLEAMAAGRAIVASDAGGLPELIADGITGLLAPSGNAAALGAAVTHLLDDAALRARLGAAARAAVEASWRDEDIAHRSLAVYRGAT